MGRNIPERDKMLSEWAAIDLSVYRAVLDKDDDDIIVVSAIRNELARLPYFLSYYRSLGLKKFVFIDNDSSDGTLEYLKTQPDVDIYLYPGPFSIVAKQIWIQKAMLNYGHGRWYLILDPDEILVFDGCECHSIYELTAAAQQQGIKRILAIMIDMYADIKGVAYAELDTYEKTVAACRYFDSVGYEYKPTMVREQITGGPRRRMMEMLSFEGLLPQLSKYPLLYFEPEDILVSAHYSYPFSKNMISDCTIGLLHYRLSNIACERIEDHSARMKIQILSHLFDLYRSWYNSEYNLFSSDSLKFESSNDLVKSGLIKKINWASRKNKLSKLNFISCLLQKEKRMRRKFFLENKSRERSDK
ncbi:glycosyltransferase family 2 protein [Desulfovibrio sp. OttesenSCG-928-I05]|nr:glycosyltransferase family 2 protein [Desulfovibrio sp. OttesenSCG-928-I05]